MDFDIFKRVPRMKFWHVWREGFDVEGHKDVARFMGKILARTFEEACVKAMGEPGTSKWGARLFDNEADARKAFG